MLTIGQLELPKPPEATNHAENGQVGRPGSWIAFLSHWIDQARNCPFVVLSMSGGGGDFFHFFKLLVEICVSRSSKHPDAAVLRSLPPTRGNPR